ncbi:MAG: hemolysin family protein [Desulfovibrionales bacterium]
MVNISIEIIIVLLLVLLNGFFAMAEMSLVAARKTRLKAKAEAGDGRARKAMFLAAKTDRFFSTVQIGITLIGILSGAFGGATLAAELTDFFASVPWLSSYSQPLGFGLVVLVITFLTLILGELVPKQIAFQAPERMALLTAPFMRVMMRISYPVVVVLSGSTRAVSKVLGLGLPHRPSITEEDIRGMIREGALAGVVEQMEKEMLDRVFRLGDRQVSALMTHRSRIVWLNIEDPFEVNLQKIMDNPHTRFPVARGDLSQTLGVIKAKDLLGACWTQTAPEILDFIDQSLIVPETTRALDLLERFKHGRGMHCALIVDEFGDLQGMVTLNDFLESLVGDVPDSRYAEPSAVQREDGSWLLDGMLPVDEVRGILGLTRPMRDPEKTFQTLAGFILHQLGHLPEIGESFAWNNLRFEVVDMDGRRIDRILVQKFPEETPNE